MKTEGIGEANACLYLLFDIMQIMKNRIITLVFALSLAMLSFAQLAGDGFYRIKNYGTNNYIWVCDNTGSVNYAATSADMGAMQLWAGLGKAISEPASVLYLTNSSDNKWDASAQGTGVYQMIQHFVQIQNVGTKDGLTFYQIYASDSGLTLFLSDVGSWGGAYNTLGTSGTGTSRRWLFEKIDAATDSYFGVKPTLKVGDKFFAPFYADFAFSFVSVGMKAYTLDRVEGDVAIIKPVDAEVIPASTPVLVECMSENPSDNRLNLLQGSYPNMMGNLLSGVYFCNEFREKSKDAITVFDAAIMRVWNVNAEGKLVLGSSTSGLHVNWWGDDGKRYLNANQSFLKVAAGTVAELKVMTEGEYQVYLASITHKVTYVLDGVTFQTVQYRKGDGITAPNVPEKEGYTFSGWVGLPTIMPGNDVTVTGLYSVNSYAVTFIYGGNVLKTIPVKYGEVIQLPVSLESDRYTLIEWMNVPETMPAHDVTIVANFVDGVRSVPKDVSAVRYYQLDGVSSANLTRGVNIVRKNDGTTSKVIVK